MANIQWSPDLSVNVSEIDIQHQQLFKMINDLDDAMRQGKGKDVVGKIINGLLSYTITHFGKEEKYFAQFNYPDAEPHKAAHGKFIDKVKGFKNDFETGKLGLSIQVMSFLNDWLRDHIKVVDKKYGPFFNQHGLK